MKLGEFGNEVRLLVLESIPGAFDFTMKVSNKRDGDRMVKLIEYPLSPVQPDAPFTLAMFSHRASPRPVAFSIEVEAKDGTRYPGDYDGFFIIDSFPVALEQIAKFHIRYGIGSQIAVFELPRVPGVPKENENITNLFDVTIPYVVTNPGTAREQVEAYTQMSVFLPGNDPKDYAYIPLRNIKVSNLLKYYLDSFGYKTAEMDSKAFSIRGK